MGRIILILTAACLVATFMIISNSSFKTTPPASPKAEDLSKKAEKDRPMKREPASRAKLSKKRAANQTQLNRPNNSNRPSDGIAVMPEEENIQGDEHLIVKGDSTPVYSVNSRHSSILRLLKKGDKVATDVDVTDAQGKWIVVKKGDLTKPGFVLDENLQRAGTPSRVANRNAGNRK